MNTPTAKATAEAEIRRLIDNYIKAARALDVDGIVGHYAPDIISYDAISQLQFKGVEAYRQHWEACLAMCPGSMIFEIDELHIVVGNDVAFCHCLNRCGITTESGEEKASWMRMTICLRTIGGTWLIVHEHFSAPFDTASGKALFDLRPEHIGQTNAA